MSKPFDQIMMEQAWNWESADRQGVNILRVNFRDGADREAFIDAYEQDNNCELEFLDEVGMVSEFEVIPSEEEE